MASAVLQNPHSENTITKASSKDSQGFEFHLNVIDVGQVGCTVDAGHGDRNGSLRPLKKRQQMTHFEHRQPNGSRLFTQRTKKDPHKSAGPSLGRKVKPHHGTVNKLLMSCRPGLTCRIANRWRLPHLEARGVLVCWNVRPLDDRLRHLAFGLKLLFPTIERRSPLLPSPRVDRLHPTF